MIDAVQWMNMPMKDKTPEPVDVEKKQAWLARAAARDKMLEERNKCQMPER